MVVNLEKILQEWRHERYMGLLLHGEADCGKSRYLQRVNQKAAKDFAVLYFDLLETASRFENKGIVLQWNPKTFLEWLLSELVRSMNDSHQAVVVDHIDFLYNLWDATKKEEFIQRISHIEKAVFNCPILFVLQDDAVIEQIKQQPETGRKPFIFAYKDLEAI